MLKKMLFWFLIFILVVVIGMRAYLQHPLFWAPASGKRLERILNSPNYRDGQFQNLTPTEVMANQKGRLRKGLANFLFREKTVTRPSEPIPTPKTNLHELDPAQNLLVWLGHSAYYFQIGTKKFAVDPALLTATPVPWTNRAFRASASYQPEDLPDLDYLIITHDHYDHLDYQTILKLKNRVAHFITPLGVGAHLERRGIEKERIIELDWHEKANPEEQMQITALPTRHFSGRTFKKNQTLRASFLLEIAGKKIYIGGDSGYDPFFKTLGQQHPDIDLAILENGQYDQQWATIHLLPEDLVQVIQDLAPKKVLTVHHAKYSLARHTRDEPLEKITQAAKTFDFPLITPMIGEVVELDNPEQPFQQWRKSAPAEETH